MNENNIEGIFSPESPNVERQQVLDAYKKLINRGITNPDRLDGSDPDVISARELEEKWSVQQGNETANDASASQRFNFERNFLYLDAGFTDTSYAAEVIFDLAEQDLHNLEDAEEGEEPNENANPELAEETRKKIAFYKEKLGLTEE